MELDKEFSELQSELVKEFISEIIESVFNSLENLKDSQLFTNSEKQGILISTLMGMNQKNLEVVRKADTIFPLDKND